MIKIANDDKAAAKLIKMFPDGVDASLSRLKFGDFAFTGRGKDDIKELIGVERKTVSDFVSSTMSGRLLGHQAPGMVYSYNRCYIVLEGLYSRHKDGSLLIRVGREWVKYKVDRKRQRFDVRFDLITHTLFSLQEFFGFRVVRTSDLHSTALAVVSLWNYWNSKAYDKHTAVNTDYTPGGPVSFKRLSLAAKMLNRIDGIGPAKAEAVAGLFNSVVEMVNGSPADFVTDGVAMATANKIYRELNKSCKR